MIRSRAQRFDDMFDLFVLVQGAFAAVDVGNVNDRLFIGLRRHHESSCLSSRPRASYPARSVDEQTRPAGCLR